jgi:hypothetical protein
MMMTTGGATDRFHKTMLIVRKEVSTYSVAKMSYTGKVKNGVVVLPADVKLPEGAEVEVVAPELADPDPFLRGAKETPSRGHTGPGITR